MRCPNCKTPEYMNNIRTRGVIVRNGKKNRFECDICGHVWPIKED